jgi:hypothetical protein
MQLGILAPVEACGGGEFVHVESLKLPSASNPGHDGGAQGFC